MTIKTVYFFKGMKKILSPLMVGIVIFLFSGGGVNAQTYRDQDGDGLIEISYIETLDSMRYNLAGTCPSPSNCTGYELTRNLDFSSTSSYRSGSINISYTQGSGWSPIGMLDKVGTDSAFNTMFEGNGFTIDNLFINRLSTDYVGLFGYTAVNTRIRNIGMTNVSVSGFSYVGALVGWNSGIITQTYATGNVTGNSWYVGGLVGANGGTITQSYATSTVTGSSHWVGGLVGLNSASGTISQSYATGNVTGSANVAGLVGWNSGTITQSYATGSVLGSSTYVGGLVGYSDKGTIIQTYATGNVTGSANVGGLVGYNDNGTIIHGYWNKNTSQIVGGSTRSNKLGIGSGSGTFVRGLTFSAMKSPNATITDSIRELGPGFRYRQGQLPKIHFGARVAVKNINFTQTVPSITNIVGNSNPVADINPGTATTRATLTVGGIAFTANIIEVTNIGTDTIKDIQNGVKKLQPINFTSIGNKTYGNIPFVLEAISSAGLSVSFSASNTLVSISNNVVTIKGVGTVSITAYSENDTILSFINQSITIQKINQSISFGTLANKTFGNASFVLSATSSARLSVSFSSSNTAIASINGSSVTIRGGGTVNITAYSLEMDTIYFASQTQILTISKARQSINLGTLQKTFGDAPFVLSVTSSGGLTISYSASSTLVSISNNTVTINGVGTVNMTAFQTGNANYLSADVVQILTIDKANQSIIFDALAQKTFRDAPFVLGATSSAGLKVFYSASNTLVGIRNDTLTIKGIGTVNITAYSLENDTLYFDSQTQIFTISKGRQSIRFGTLQKTFGDAPFILSPTSSAGLSVSYSASSILVSININIVTIHGAGTVSISAYQTENINYLKADSVVRILTINKAGQSITFGALQKNFGDAPFVLSPTSSVGLSVSYSASSTLVSISNNTVTINGVGMVNITAYQIGNANYLKADSVVQILTIIEPNSISKITPTFTFIDIPNLTVGQRYILLADSNSPSDITFTSSDNNKLSIVGNVATAKAKGNVTLTAHQAGNVQYNSATLTQSLTVLDPALLVAAITFAAIPNLTIGQRYALVANSNSPVDITFTSSDNDKVGIVGNIATGKGKGNVTITASQEGNKEYNAAVSDQNTTVLYLVSLINFAATPNLTIGQRYTLLATSNSPVAITFTSSDNDKLSIVRGIAIAKVKGNVIITANQAENAQYNDAVSVQNITVLDPDLQLATINFTAIPNLIIGQKYTLVVSSNSPVPILFISSNSQVATLRGNTLTAVGTGTAVITAIQSGNAEFNATTAQKTVIVNKTGTTPALTFVETPNNSIRIFPNPANDYITISYDKTQKVSSVKIYDMTGKSYELKMNHDVLGIKADVKHLPKGEYILVIYGEKGEVLKTELLVFSY